MTRKSTSREKRVSVNLTEREHAALEALSKKLRRSLSDVLVEGLYLVMEKHPDKHTPLLFAQWDEDDRDG